MGRREIGVGVIGLGWMGRLHARSYRAVPERWPELGVAPRLVLAADPVSENREAAVDHLGFAAATENWRAVVADPRVDVVSICVPNRKLSMITTMEAVTSSIAMRSLVEAIRQNRRSRARMASRHPAEMLSIRRGVHSS